MGSLLQMFCNSISPIFKVEDSAKILLDMLSQKKLITNYRLMLCNISEDQRLDLHILVYSWYDALGLSVYFGLHGQYRCRKQLLPEHQQLYTNSNVIITRTVESLLHIYPTVLIKYATYL
jgi:hypothetical protein